MSLRAAKGERKALTRDKEVGGGLTVGRLVPHVDEVLPRPVRGTEVNLLSLVDDADLVEDLVQLLACLVDGDDTGLTADVGRDADGLDELECSRSIETSSRAFFIKKNHD